MQKLKTISTAIIEKQGGEVGPLSGSPSESISPDTSAPYVITRDGKVYSRKTNRYLKFEIDHHEYYKVTLSTTGGNQKYRVNRLVAFFYVENPLNLPHVGHRDNDKKNNDASNLYWTANIDNARHSRTGEGNGCNKLTWLKVTDIRHLSRMGHTITEISIKYSVSRTTIKKIVENKRWVTGEGRNDI